MRARAVVAGLTLAATSLVPSAPAGAAPGDATVVASGLAAPSGVAVAPDGTVYATAGDSVVRVSGDQATAIVSGLSSPRGVAVASDGTVYAAEAGAGRVVQVTSGTAETLASGLDRPTGLAWAGDHLLVAETGASRILSVSTSGAVTAVAGGDGSLAFPTGVATAGSDVLVADTFHSVVRRLGAGGATTVAGGGTTASSCLGDGGPATATPISPPTAVAGDPSGNVYVADAGNRRVVRVGGDGSLTTIATATFPAAVAMAPDGDLLVADSGAGSILRVASAATAFTTPVDRVAGGDRYATAALLSARLFPAGAAAAFVTTGERFADALAASGAAGAAGAPVLLTRRDALPSSTADELRRLSPGRVVVVGGTAAVSDTVLAAIAGAAGVTPARVAGEDRYATAAALSATSFGSGIASAVLVSGEAFADALSGGAMAALAGVPVLLARRDALPASTAAELQRLHPARVTIVGGTAAVSDAVEAAARDASGGTTERIPGADRYETSANVAGRATSATTVLVATGNGFADGLAAAAAAKRAGGPVLLVPCFDVPAPVAAARQRLASAPALVVGGVTAVPELPAHRVATTGG